MDPLPDNVIPFKLLHRLGINGIHNLEKKGSNKYLKFEYTDKF